jgi:chromosome segregation ATPase
MISLEQVRTLEDRVERAVAYIASLRKESAELERRLAEAQSFIDDAANELAAAEEKASAAERRAEASEALRQAEAQRIREIESRLGDMAERVAAAETRSAELNARAEDYRRDQAKIEEGIVHALEKLDSFEDLVLGQVPVEGAKAAPEAEEGDFEAVGSGIAVKSAPDAEPRGRVPEPEAAPNELDIF